MLTLSSVAHAKWSYVVTDEGETLSSVAFRVYGNASKWKKIAKWNSITTPNVLEIGTRLELLEEPNYQPQEGSDLLVKMWVRRIAERGDGPWRPDFVPSAGYLFPKSGSATPAPDEPVALKVNFFSGSLGVASISYKEANRPDFTMTNLTAKFSYRRPLAPPHWSADFNIFFTAAALSQSRSDVTVRYLGVNARAGYKIPSIKSPWRLSVFGGFYYTTMMVSNDAFGYRNMFWPQFFPAVACEIDDRNVVNAYVKFAPMADGFELLPFSNHEIAVGTGWTRALSNGHPLSVNLDYANFAIKAKALDLSNTAISLSASYGF